MIPTLKLDGNEHNAMRLKAGIWRAIMALEEKKATKELDIVEFIAEHCRVLAMAYPVTAGEIEADLPLDEVIPAYHALHGYVVELVATKLKQVAADPKNVLTVAGD